MSAELTPFRRTILERELTSALLDAVLQSTDGSGTVHDEHLHNPNALLACIQNALTTFEIELSDPFSLEFIVHLTQVARDQRDIVARDITRVVQLRRPYGDSMDWEAIFSTIAFNLIARETENSKKETFLSPRNRRLQAEY